MLKPNELFIGAVVNYDTGEGILPCVIDAQGLLWIEEYTETFNIYHSPIPITPEILTDWCGWKNIHYGNQVVIIVGGKTNQFVFRNYLFSNTKHIVFKSERLDHIQYLHQLQALYLLLTGEVMPINLPKNQ